jgi:hypothetical protein
MKNQKPKKQSKKKLVATVDATPSWESLAGLFIEWIQSGNSQQHQDASESIFKMAKLSDAYRANLKKIEMHDEIIVLLKSIKRKGSVYPFHLMTIQEFINQSESIK